MSVPNSLTFATSQWAAESYTPNVNTQYTLTNNYTRQNDVWPHHYHTADIIRKTKQSQRSRKVRLFDCCSPIVESHHVNIQSTTGQLSLSIVFYSLQQLSSGKKRLHVQKYYLAFTIH